MFKFSLVVLFHSVHLYSGYPAPLVVNFYSEKECIVASNYYAALERAYSAKCHPLGMVEGK